MIAQDMHVAPRTIEHWCKARGKLDSASGCMRCRAGQGDGPANPGKAALLCGIGVGCHFVASIAILRPVML